MNAANCFKEEAAWSGDHQRKTEEDKNVKLIKCLRGRLFAERQTTRAAKEEAQLKTQKLIELEKKLMQEMKLRDRAEKRLKLLKEKLKLFNKSDQTPSEVSFVYSSSSSCSCVSLSTSSILRTLNVPEDEKPENQLDYDNVSTGHEDPI